VANFLSPLDLRYLDGRFFEVRAPFGYAVGAPDGKTVVNIPIGFKTDFASIPRVFWSLLPPTGWYGKAACVHDFLYQYANINGMVIDRKYADDVLNECMCVLKAAWILERGFTKPDYPQMPRGELVTLIEREIIYKGVRIGGFPTWRKYRKADPVS